MTRQETLLRTLSLDELGLVYQHQFSKLAGNKSKETLIEELKVLSLVALRSSITYIQTY